MLVAVAYTVPYLCNFKKCKVKGNKPFVTKYSSETGVNVVCSNIRKIMYHQLKFDKH